MITYLLLTAFFAGALCQEWTRFPAHVVHFSAKGNEIWATTQVNNVLRWVDDNWKFTNAGAQLVAASSDGRAWAIRTDAFAYNVFRYIPANNTFESMFANLHQISAATGDSAVGVNFLGDVYQYQNKDWKKLPGKALHVAMGVDSSIFSIDVSAGIWRLVNGQWQQMPGNGIYIEAHDKDRIVMIDYNQDLFTWAGENGWQQLGGKKCVKASIANDKVYCQESTGGVVTTTLAG